MIRRSILKFVCVLALAPIDRRRATGRCVNRRQAGAHPRPVSAAPGGLRGTP